MTISPCEQPNYTEILYLIQEEDADYPLNKTVITWSGYGSLNQSKSQIIRQFNSYYQFREIGAETRDRWLKLVTKRFNEIARTYNHAFKVYEENSDKIDDLGREIIKSKTYGSNVKDTFQDTPVTPITTGTSYATSINDKDKTGTDTETTQDNSEMYIVEINKLIKEYDDLVLKFVKEFEPCFMSTIMRV